MNDVIVDESEYLGWKVENATKIGSCKFCKKKNDVWNTCTVSGENIYVKVRGKSGCAWEGVDIRWDRCDEFEPVGTCKTCKWRNTVWVVVRDEDVEKAVCTKNCDMSKEHCENWERKESLFE